MAIIAEAETPKDEQPTFDVLPLSPEVRSAVDELGYVHPTPVQRAVFESAARGKDLVVQARTGTGKTAAFGLPLADRLVRRKVKAVQALVLCPTRELALQVTRELESLGKNTGIAVLPVYGGAPMLRQIEGLRDGAQILVGTPGRVLDHLRRKTLDPSKIRVLVLDECDEMLSMGFLPQITEIWNQLPKELQVLLFSATVPRPVLRVADSRLREPEFITLSGDQIGALEIEHYVYLSQGDKMQELLRILKAESPESAIVFCNTRDDTQRVATELKRAGYNADWLNADLSQKEREAVMLATREGRLTFLVCTDVAARGIDISHLTHVINFDFPEATEQYVHRTGRTGRAGRMGTAISLVSPASIGNLYYLRLEYKIHPSERQLPSDRELRTRAETDTILQLAGRFPTPREAERSLVQRLLTHERSESIIAGLLREHLAATGADAPGDALRRPPRLPAPGTRGRVAEGLVAEGMRGTVGDEAPAQAPAPAGRRRERSAVSDRMRAPADRAANDSSGDVRGADGRAATADGAANDSAASLDRAVDNRATRAASDRTATDRTAIDRTAIDRTATGRVEADGAAGDAVSGDRAATVARERTRAERPVEPSRTEPSRIEASRERRERGRPESPALRRGPRAPRSAAASFSEEGFSYEVRDVSAGDLARLADPVGPAVSSGAVLDMAAPSPEAGGISHWDGPVDEAFVNVGRDDGVRTSDLHQALSTAGVSQDDTAYVRIRQRHTFIGVRQGLLDRVVSGLNGQKIAQRLVEAQPARPRQARR
jgi:ATP-dependent RNA helicase DeaD